MRKYRGHKRLAVTLAAMLGEHKDVYQVGKGYLVGDDAGKSNLSITKEAAEAERMLNGPLDHCKWNAFGPSALLREKLMDERNIQFCLFRRDTKIFHSPLTPGLSRPATC